MFFLYLFGAPGRHIPPADITALPDIALADAAGNIVDVGLTFLRLQVPLIKHGIQIGGEIDPLAGEADDAA